MYNCMMSIIPSSVIYKVFKLLLLVIPNLSGLYFEFIDLQSKRSLNILKFVEALKG